MKPKLSSKFEDVDCSVFTNDKGFALVHFRGETNGQHLDRLVEALTAEYQKHDKLLYLGVIGPDAVPPRIDIRRDFIAFLNGLSQNVRLAHWFQVEGFRSAVYRSALMEVSGMLSESTPSKIFGAGDAACTWLGSGIAGDSAMAFADVEKQLQLV